VNEEVVNLAHEVIDATIIVVPNPRKKVLDGFFQGMFKIRSKQCNKTCGVGFGEMLLLR
jgi:hypothetical protein